MLCPDYMKYMVKVLRKVMKPETGRYEVCSDLQISLFVKAYFKKRRREPVLVNEIARSALGTRKARVWSYSRCLR